MDPQAGPDMRFAFHCGVVHSFVLCWARRANQDEALLAVIFSRGLVTTLEEAAAASMTSTEWDEYIRGWEVPTRPGEIEDWSGFERWLTIRTVAAGCPLDVATVFRPTGDRCRIVLLDWVRRGRGCEAVRFAERLLGAVVEVYCVSYGEDLVDGVTTYGN